MRLLHTADWHLGHVLHDHPRTYEHARFLAWLLEEVGRREADALLVAGDVFDGANPPTDATDAFYGFLADLRRLHPAVGLVVIGGNHDSPSRLETTNPVLARLGVHVVGRMPRRGGAPDPGRCVLPLCDRSGRRAAWVVTVPFLRPVDLPLEGGREGRSGGESDPLIEGVRRLTDQVLDEARRRRGPGEALVVLSHCYMSGTRLSELSERKILGGNQHALPADLFPEDVDYVALGHLHLAQAVDPAGRIRYSGSPLPLSFAEVSYPHQVLCVDVEAGKPPRVTTCPVPRSVDLLRVPGDRARPLPEVLDLLRRLPVLDPAQDSEARPLLEVRVLLDAPQPTVRREVEEALRGKAPRLLRVGTELAGSGAGLAEQAAVSTLRDVTPEEVLRRIWSRDHAGEPPADLLAAFAELQDHAARGEEAP